MEYIIYKGREYHEEKQREFHAKLFRMNQELLREYVRVEEANRKRGK